MSFSRLISENHRRADRAVSFPVIAAQAGIFWTDELHIPS